MSKIQEALKRMQTNGYGARVRKKSGADNSDHPVAKIALADKEQSQADTAVLPEFIVEIDYSGLRDAGLLPPEQDENVLANQYRDIKRPLIANAYGKRVVRVENGNMIMVTSAMAGEGKTFTALNLAMSIAREQDLTVLLVDGDVAKQHLSDALGLTDTRGLLDALDDNSLNPESLVLPTDVDGLSILPAGGFRGNAAELLAGSRMEELVQDLCSRFPQRVVVFDTPPLLETSESKVLANIAGQIVLVVKAESTSRSAVAETLQLLGDDRVVGLVLNQAKSIGRSGRYEYGYGYSANKQ